MATWCKTMSTVMLNTAFISLRVCCTKVIELLLTHQILTHSCWWGEKWFISFSNAFTQSGKQNALSNVWTHLSESFSKDLIRATITPTICIPFLIKRNKNLFTQAAVHYGQTIRCKMWYNSTRNSERLPIEKSQAGTHVVQCYFSWRSFVI